MKRTAADTKLSVFQDMWQQTADPSSSHYQQDAAINGTLDLLSELAANEREAPSLAGVQAALELYERQWHTMTPEMLNDLVHIALRGLRASAPLNRRTAFSR